MPVYPKKLKVGTHAGYLCTRVHGRFIHDSHKVEATDG